jgi:uncharacterized protein (TIGR00251 family)
MADDAWWRAVDDGIVVQVRVTPGASRSEVVGVRDGRLAVRVRGRAVEGQANAALIEALAVAFAVRPRAVTITAGEHHRSKTVHVADVLAPPADLGGVDRPE